tara:strand:- start:2860 stop:4113 length:1254 start_codon:yes stop_codon:yes gene_type:complete
MEYIPPRRKLFNEHLVFDDSQIDEIPGEFYLYYIRLTTEFLSPAFEMTIISNNAKTSEKSQARLDTHRTQCKIPIHVKDDMNSGRAKLVLDYSTEGYWDIDWEWVSNVLEVNEDRIIWLTSMYNFADCSNGADSKYAVSLDKTSAEVRYNPLWERIVIQMCYPHSKDIEKQINLIDSLHERPSMALTYNRRPHFHRVALLSGLHYHNELNNMIWSWYGFQQEKEEGAKLWQKKIDNYSGWHNQLLHEKYKESYDTMLLCPPHGDEDLSTNKAFDMNYSHIYDTYYQVITETLYEQPGIFLSEKSYKPFLSCQPFVLCGQSGTVNVLRLQGYDVYDTWINHEYDNIIDDKKRMSATMKEISRLNSLSHNEWTKMLKEMLPTIKKNLRNLMNSYDKKDVLSFNYSEPKALPPELIDISS